MGRSDGSCWIHEKVPGTDLGGPQCPACKAMIESARAPLPAKERAAGPGKHGAYGQGVTISLHMRAWK